MNIAWNGLGSVVVTAKIGQDEVSLVTNPFAPVGSLKFPKLIPASLVVKSHEGEDTGHDDAVAPEHEGDKPPFVIDHAGEYEVRGMFVTGISAPKKDGTPHSIYRFDAESMHIGFLGAIDRPLSSKEQEALGAVDILLIPAGGGGVLSPSAAAQAVAQIEPRIVIPIYVSATEDDGVGEVSAFVREMSAPQETVTKFKITRAALPEDELRVVILSRG